VECSCFNLERSKQGQAVWKDEIHFTDKGANAVAKVVLARLARDHAVPTPGTRAALAEEGAKGSVVTEPFRREAPLAPEKPSGDMPAVLPPSEMSASPAGDAGGRL